MTEILHHMSHEPIADPAIEVTPNFDEAEAFLRDVAPHIGRLFGLNLNIQIGDGWATDLESGNVTADPKFFTERGYSSEQATYATLHEVVSHLDEVVTEPDLTREVIRFVSKGEPQSIFHNIFADIAGNKRTHAVLPKQADVATDLYENKLFPDPNPESGDRIKDGPRHLQFLYSIIRREMIPGAATIVFPEVRAAIDSLRNYKGQGDLLKLSTDPKHVTGLSARQQFDIWTKVIYPTYEELLEQDELDPNFQNQDSSGQDGESVPANPQPGEDQGGKPSDQNRQKGQFDKHYKDYRENKHPEPMSPEEHDKLHNHANKITRGRRQSPQKKLDEKIRQETGHTLNEKRAYDQQVEQWLDAIDEMRQVFQSVLQERITVKRGLGKQAKTEGAILDPNKLAQTAIDIRSGVTEPPAFLDFEVQKRQGEMVGKTDWVFVFDASISMFEGDGEKAKSAQASAVIALEGLAAMQRDLERAEAKHGAGFELDVRTAVYVFGDTATMIKDLSSTLSDKQRMDTLQAVGKSSGGTADYLALEDIAHWDKAHDRRQIVVVVSDGESNNPDEAKKHIDNLRNKGWEVIGISLGSDAAEQLYAPTAKRTDNPAELPKTIKQLIEESYA